MNGKKKRGKDMLFYIKEFLALLFILLPWIIMLYLFNI